MWDTEAVHGNRSEHRSPLQVFWFVEWEEIMFPIAPFFWTKERYWIIKKKKKNQSHSRRVKMCDCLKNCGALWGTDASLSHIMLGTLYKGPLVWTTEKMEVHRHLCPVSLGSSIKAFLPSVLSTGITSNVGLVLTGSEDPDETCSWPWCWTT